MKNKLLSLFFSILLISSVFTPVVNAAPPDDIEEPTMGAIQIIIPAAAPEACEIIIAGMTIVTSGAVVVEIGDHIGEIWDKTLENWDSFVKSVSAGLDTIFTAKNWVKITSPKGEAAMKALYECYCADIPPDGKKDSKWYFEARRHNGEIEINTERMNEEQAVKQMQKGKDIVTLNEGLAQQLVDRFAKIDRPGYWGSTETIRPHHDKPGYYYHMHYGRTAVEHLHCWLWRHTK